MIYNHDLATSDDWTTTHLPLVTKIDFASCWPSRFAVASMMCLGAESSRVYGPSGCSVKGYLASDAVKSCTSSSLCFANMIWSIGDLERSKSENVFMVMVMVILWFVSNSMSRSCLVITKSQYRRMRPLLKLMRRLSPVRIVSNHFGITDASDTTEDINDRLV